MAAGQLLLAIATGLPLAIAARVLVGTGDALTFISVLSVVTAWFPPRRVPLMTQLTGLLGQLGQMLSAPSRSPHCCTAPGWTPAFASAAALGVAVAVAVLVVLRDRPPGAPPPPPGARRPREVLRGAALVVARAGHPARAVDPHGHPVLRHGLRAALGRALPRGGAGFLAGRRRARCSRCSSGRGSLAGPLFGEFTARHPLRRSWLVIAVILLTAAAWTAVLARPAARAGAGCWWYWSWCSRSADRAR